jgi:Flp pilus assembly pilin Flp
MKSPFTKKNRKGAALIEYLMLVMLIALACVVTVRALGVTVDTKYGEVNTEVSSW